MIQKLKMLRWLIQASIAINIFFVSAGCWGLIRYSSTLEFGYGFFAAVGLATLIFGIIIPAVIIHKLVVSLAQIKDKIQSQGTQFAAHWLEKASRDKGTFKSPKFWTDLLLYGAQWGVQNSKSPMAEIVKGIAPAIRDELRRTSAKDPKKPKGKVKKSKTKRAA